jgi:hypothetical protein
MIKKVLYTKFVRKKINNNNLYKFSFNFIINNFFLLSIISLKSELINNLRINLKKFNFNISKLKINFLNKKNIFFGEYLLLRNINNLLEFNFFLDLIEKNNISLNYLNFYLYIKNKLVIYKGFYLKQNLLFLFNEDNKFKIINFIFNKFILFLNLLLNYLYLFFQLIKYSKNANL